MRIVQGMVLAALASGGLIAGRDIYAAGPPMLLRALESKATKLNHGDSHTC